MKKKIKYQVLPWYEMLKVIAKGTKKTVLCLSCDTAMASIAPWFPVYKEFARTIPFLNEKDRNTLISESQLILLCDTKKEAHSLSSQILVDDSVAEGAVCAIIMNKDGLVEKNS